VHSSKTFHSSKLLLNIRDLQTVISGETDQDVETKFWSLTETRLSSPGRNETTTIFSMWWWCYPTPSADGGSKELRWDPSVELHPMLDQRSKMQEVHLGLCRKSNCWVWLRNLFRKIYIILFSMYFLRV